MRIVDSLSTFRFVGAGPIGRSDDNGASSSASTCSRSVGTAQICEWTAALTSSHQARACSFEPARSASTRANSFPRRHHNGALLGGGVAG